MNENAKENLTMAREMLMGGHIKDACTHYYEIKEGNPENAEAAFFADYLAFLLMIEENDGSAAARALISMRKNVENTVKCIREAEFEDDGLNTDLTSEQKQEVCRLLLLSKMVEIYVPIIGFLFKKRIATSSTAIETSVSGLYALGDAIEKEFDAKPEFMKEAIVAWKEAVLLQRTYYAYKYGVNPEDYAIKIQKFDPSYTMPKKAGCVTLG